VLTDNSQNHKSHVDRTFVRHMTHSMSEGKRDGRGGGGGGVD